MDINNDDIDKKIETVNNVLNDIEVEDTEIVKVFNKIDLVNENKIEEIQLTYPDSVFISAKNGKSKDQLVNKVSKIIKKSMSTVNLDIPYDKANLVEKIYNEGKVLEEKYLNDHIYIKASISNKLASILNDYRRLGSDNNN